MAWLPRSTADKDTKPPQFLYNWLFGPLVEHNLTCTESTILKDRAQPSINTLYRIKNVSIKISFFDFKPGIKSSSSNVKNLNRILHLRVLICLTHFPNSNKRPSPAPAYFFDFFQPRKYHLKRVKYCFFPVVSFYYLLVVHFTKLHFFLRNRYHVLLLFLIAVTK